MHLSPLRMSQKSCKFARQICFNTPYTIHPTHMKKFFLTAIAACLITFPAQLWAITEYGYCGSDGDGSNARWGFDTETATLTIEGTGAIKEYHNGNPAGDQPWYNYNDQIKHVIVKDGITAIQGDFICGLPAVETLELGADVDFISESAITVLDALKSLTISPDNPKYDSRNNCNAVIETATNTLVIGTNATVIPPTVTTIAERAFYFCRTLRSITIPDDVESLDQWAFTCCPALDSVYVGAGLRSIGTQCFKFCPIRSFVISPDNPVFDSRENCNAIIETANNTFRMAFPGSFIPSTVDSIALGVAASVDFDSILAIPDNVKKIAQSAFYQSTYRYLFIGKGVESIGNGAFVHHYGKRDVFFTAATPPVCGENLLEKTDNLSIFVPLGTADSYKQALPGYEEYIHELAEMDDARIAGRLNAARDTLTLYDALQPGPRGFIAWPTECSSDSGMHVTTVVIDPSLQALKPHSTHAWFRHFRQLSSIVGLEYLNTSELTDMSAMFEGTNLTKIDLSALDCPNVTDTRRMFADNPRLTTIACPFDFSKAEHLTSSAAMFAGATLLRGNYGTPYQAARIDSTFARPDDPFGFGYFSADTLTADSLSEQGVYAVLSEDKRTLTLYADDNCEANHGIKDWAHRSFPSVLFVLTDPSLADATPASLHRWFTALPNVIEIDLRHLNWTNVTDMSYMFAGANKLRRIYCDTDCATLRDDDTPRLRSDNAFLDCYALVGQAATAFDRMNTDSAYAHLDSDIRPGYFSAVPEHLPNVMGPNDVIYCVSSGTPSSAVVYCDDQKDARGGWDDWSNTSYCEAKTVIYDPSFAKARLTSLQNYLRVFQYARTFEGLEYINTSQVTDMSYLFTGCENVAVLDLTTWDFSAVNNIRSMFRNCNHLQRIYCTADLSQIESGNNVFYHCYHLQGNVSGKTYDESDVSGAFAKLDNGYFSLPEKETLALHPEIQPDKKTLVVRPTYGAFGDVSWQWFNADNHFEIETVRFDPAAAAVAPTSAKEWFKNYTSLKTVDLTYLNTSELTNTESMFAGCSALTTIYSPNSLITNSLIPNSDQMFAGCEHLVGGLGTAYDDAHTDATYARPDADNQPGYFTSSLVPLFCVSFIDYDESVLAARKVQPHHAALPPEEEPFRPDYLFLGWDRSDEELADVTEDMIVNAWYRKHVFTVRFLDWDGTLLDKQKVKRGRDAVPPEDPERTGYLFIGWDTEFTNVQKDLDITALYQSTEDLEPLTANPSPVTEKVIRSGCLYLLRNGQLYSPSGQLIR